MKAKIRQTKKHHSFWEILKDKNGYYNLREVVGAICVTVILVGWVSQQFLGFEFPEYMFYGFVSMIASSCFGYSIERKQIKNEEVESDLDPNEKNI